MIWKYLVTSVINEANSSEKRQYRLCPPVTQKPYHPSLFGCVSMPSCNNDHSRELSDRLRHNVYYRECHCFTKAEDVRPLIVESGLDAPDLELARLVLTGDKPIKNPLVNFLCINKQVEAEIKATAQRIFPSGRYLSVKCCCGRSRHRVGKQSSIIRPVKVDFGPFKRAYKWNSYG